MVQVCLAGVAVLRPYEDNRKRPVRAKLGRDGRFGFGARWIVILAAMFEKKSGDDIFSLGRKPISPLPTFDAEPYSPYAAAWKQFDKLQKEAKGRGSTHWVRVAGEALVFNAGALGFRHGLRKNGLLIAAAWAAVALLELFQWHRRKKQFLHWPCPRCHSEWPGTKTEKDRACKVCGLRLHQLTP